MAFAESIRPLSSNRRLTGFVGLIISQFVVPFYLNVPRRRRSKCIDQANAQSDNVTLRGGIDNNDNHDIPEIRYSIGQYESIKNTPREHTESINDRIQFPISLQIHCGIECRKISYGHCYAI